MSSDENLVLLSIGSRFENIELVQVVLDDSLRETAMDDDSRYWVGIALREALANAIKHGNKEDPAKQVEVELRIDEEQVIVLIQDQGEGFDPKGVENPLEPDNLLKPDGRGIFYMNRFMDEITYDFAPEGGTVVKLRKRFDSPPPEQGD
ncbi:MAG: ATP-binding protein [Acidobacteriota bacterium]